MTAVRTLDTKLIRYAVKAGGLPEWTEMFDLVNDPYELHNLYNDPAHAERQEKIVREYYRLREELGYEIPDAVVRPPWWDIGMPGSDNVVIAVDRPESQLTFTFDNDGASQIRDSSGKGNHGTPVGRLVAAVGENGEPAKRFDGRSWINLGRTPSLNFAFTPWTTEVIFRADEPDGVLISVGGATNGYSLRLEEGRLIYTVTIDGRSREIATQRPVSGWNKATMLLTADRRMILYVGNRRVGERSLPSLIPLQPNHAYRIGGNTDTAKNLPNFVGVISSVKLIRGSVAP